MDRGEGMFRFLKMTDPFFCHPWLTYDRRIRSLLTPQAVWVDAGCGENGLVRAHGHFAKKAVGVDRKPSPGSPGNFVKADLEDLPFRSACADLVTLGFVAEHLSDMRQALGEISRVLKDGGRALILTTNSRSPLVFLPRTLLPFRLKRRILAKYWQTSPESVFPTPLRVMGPRTFLAGGKDLRLERLGYFSDINRRQTWIFAGQLLWHLLTQPKPLQQFRTTMLITLVKNPPGEA